MLTYYDSRIGRNRYKRRFVWALWAFGGGILMGMLVAQIL